MTSNFVIYLLLYKGNLNYLSHIRLDKIGHLLHNDKIVSVIIEGKIEENRGKG